MRTASWRASRALFAGLAIIFSGCAGFETEINSLSFHEGQAESNEEILLRNIILAAHDKTPTFVAANGISSQGKASASVQATFNRINSVGHIVTPTIGGERGQTVSILDYGATKAAKYLYRDLKEGVFRDLVLRGWPGSLITTLLFNAVVVPTELDDAINEIAAQKCRAPNDSDTRAYCRRIVNLLRSCPDLTKEHHSGAVVVYANTARTICAFERFQLHLLRGGIAGTDVNFRTKESVQTKKVTRTNGSTEIEETFGWQLKFAPGFSNHRLLQLQSDLKRRGLDVKFFLRSPKDIIEFLGRLAALQLYYEPPYVPKILVPTESGPALVAPFRVVQSTSLSGPPAVSVNIRGLGAYHVPQSDPVSAGGDQSVRVMSFVIELQNRARQEAPIQGTGIAILQ